MVEFKISTQKAFLTDNISSFPIWLNLGLINESTWKQEQKQIESALRQTKIGFIDWYLMTS